MVDGKKHYLVKWKGCGIAAAAIHTQILIEGEHMGARAPHPRPTARKVRSKVQGIKLSRICLLNDFFGYSSFISLNVIIQKSTIHLTQTFSFSLSPQPGLGPSSRHDSLSSSTCSANSANDSMRLYRLSGTGAGAGACCVAGGGTGSV
jgi:hypothetical protein